MSTPFDDPTPPRPTLPHLPMHLLGRTVAQRLADPVQGLPAVEALTLLGLCAFDRLQWTPDAHAVRERDVARPRMEDQSVWACALAGVTDGPSAVIERLAQALDDRLAHEQDQGLALALAHWFDDDWGVVDLIREQRPPAVVRWVLQRALRTVRHAPGPWPAAAMQQRCRDVLSPHPHEAVLPPEWCDPVGRSLVQGMMVWSMRLPNPEHVCQLIELGEEVGLPRLAWDTRWHHQLPSKPAAGVGLTSAPYLLHLARLDRWTVVMWWLHRMPDPWAMGRCHRPATGPRDARDGWSSLAHTAWEQACGGAVLGLYNDSNASEGRVGVLMALLDAAAAGHPTARATLHDGLLGLMREGLAHGEMKDGSPDQQRALLDALVAYEQTCLRSALPPDGGTNAPDVPAPGARRRL